MILPFSSSKQYDFLVNQGGHLIWRWSNERMFAMMLTILNLDPLESKVFQVIWPQKDKTGRQVRPGIYEATGFLEIQGRPLFSSIQFEIR